ncbi:MAG: SAM-dependent chlorinase/fluorinase [Dehalococcoidia bacterium]|nr:SAM-dependent chlorinase/fluorinase [Dehalococcoidia bacterium]
MGNIITLISDFGTRDAYVGAMKGVILGINPAARVIDITHEIEPQNISQAAYILNSVHHYFPEGTVHLVVVDPSVGSDRRAIILRTDKALFVAPDNGVLSYVSGDMIEAAVITNSHFWLKPVSATFHGRDIFAPVAAHLSLGNPLYDFGAGTSSLVVLPSLQPKIEGDGTIIGKVVHIDHFGNLITNMKQSDLPEAVLQIEVKGHVIQGLSSSYAKGSELLALIESNGFLEIALQNGNAAALLAARVGDQVRVRQASGYL